MTTKQLIEDYEKRIKTATAMLRDLEKDGTDVEQHRRVSIKRSCYNTFLSELEKIEQDSTKPDLLEALQELIQVKEWKDKNGKDEHYLKAQPVAWENASKAVLKATKI